MAALAGKVGAIEKRLDGINFAHEEASSAAAQQAALAGYAAKLRRQRWVSRHPRRGRLTRHKKGGFRDCPPGLPPSLTRAAGAKPRRALVEKMLSLEALQRCVESRPATAGGAGAALVLKRPSSQPAAGGTAAKRRKGP